MNREYRGNPTETRPLFDLSDTDQALACAALSGLGAAAVFVRGRPSARGRCWAAAFLALAAGCVAFAVANTRGEAWGFRARGLTWSFVDGSHALFLVFLTLAAFVDCKAVSMGRFPLVGIAVVAYSVALFLPPLIAPGTTLRYVGPLVLPTIAARYWLEAQRHDRARDSVLAWVLLALLIVSGFFNACSRPDATASYVWPLDWERGFHAHRIGVVLVWMFCAALPRSHPFEKWISTKVLRFFHDLQLITCGVAALFALLLTSSGFATHVHVHEASRSDWTLEEGPGFAVQRYVWRNYSGADSHVAVFLSARYRVRLAAVEVYANDPEGELRIVWLSPDRAALRGSPREPECLAPATPEFPQTFEYRGDALVLELLGER